MDLSFIDSIGTTDFIICPRTNKKVDTKECMVCEYLRIALKDKIKCGWSKQKEDLKNGRIIIDTNGYIIPGKPKFIN